MNSEPAFIQERTAWRAALRRLQRGSQRNPAPPSRRVGLGLIGAGNVARWQHLPWVRRHPGHFRIAAVFDLDRTRALEVATEFGAIVCSSAEELAMHSEVEAVLVCTPDPLHAEGALAAITARKHALVEKPFGTDPNEAHHVWQAAKANPSLTNMVNFSFRFRPEFALMRQLVARGILGEIYHLWGSVSQGRWFHANGQPSCERPDASAWKFNEGVLMDLGPHVLDLARWWLGDIASVQAWTKHLPGTEGEASCGISLAFESGATAQLLTSRLATGTKEQTFLEVAGSAGAMRLREGIVELWTRTTPRWRRLMVPQNVKPGLACYYDAIAGRRVEIPTFWDGYKNNEALAAAAQSAESGRTVALPLSEERNEIHPEFAQPWREPEAAGVFGLVEKIKRGIAAAL